MIFRKIVSSFVGCSVRRQSVNYGQAENVEEM